MKKMKMWVARGGHNRRGECQRGAITEEEALRQLMCDLARGDMTVSAACCQIKLPKVPCFA
ncbi:hypothetical protein E2C01_083283 [Portunus trituberculatus]|uniref:Uncharacterized protein n=1 Tax=Portunus trituberculatus TaxID=210409 RepID=A0A5B7IWT4_PORTR|nr:hypothetical protein [Portunus trituberculatus]